MKEGRVAGVIRVQGGPTIPHGSRGGSGGVAIETVRPRKSS